jgi:ADP-ribosylglycohydrolase
MDHHRRVGPAPAASVASLRGLAVGDALGSCFFVPANLPALQARSLSDPDWPWTDDTEMACSVFAVLEKHGRIDQEALAASFAAHHDFDRGYGPGVNRMLRLIRQEGASWRELAAAAFDGRGSWGNGAAMRVAPLGAYLAATADEGDAAVPLHGGDDSAATSLAAVLDRVAAEAATSAEVTHTHPEAIAGAIAVALAAALAVSRPDLVGGPLLRAVAGRTPAGRVRDGLDAAVALLPSSDPLAAANVLGNGRATSAPDTVPFCLWVAAKHPRSFADAFWAAASAGGDVDTNCAIVGGIVASRTGLAGIPGEWLRRCEPLPTWVGVVADADAQS